jgi:hypothetical protein
MRVLLLFLSFSLISQRSHAQDDRLLLQNSSIKYQILYIGPQLLDSSKATPSKYLIRVRLNNSERKTVKSFDKAEWIKLLLNDKSDWAANLTLYDLYHKDAILYNTVIKSRADWVRVNKEKDISYWKTFLK